MKVYIVERCYDYEGCAIQAVFSSREEAEAWATIKNAKYGYTNDTGPNGVTEWTVDDAAAP